MALQEILDRTRAAGEAKRDPATVASMYRAVDELRTSGAIDRILRPDQPITPFTLQGQDGRIFDSAAVLARGGPLVITFYRGTW